MPGASSTATCLAPPFTIAGSKPAFGVSTVSQIRKPSAHRCVQGARGLNLVASLEAGERTRGVITASTGNHGQSIAYAAQTFGMRAVIVMPEESNPDKVESMVNLGAEIVFFGQDFEDARLKAEQLARDRGMHYVHPANEPLLIAGVGTYGLEIVEDLPDVQTIIVPIGAGSGICGAAIVAKSIRPQIRIIGVQAEQAPAFICPGNISMWSTRQLAPPLPKAWPHAPLLNYRCASCVSWWTISSWSGRKN